MENQEYVHGYSERESERLQDQAHTLTDLLHHDTVYPPGSLILEAGCGVGAQTVTLSKNSPEARFHSIDVSRHSLDAAAKSACDCNNVEFRQADIFHLPYAPDTFDHVFLCFVLEHLPNPREALENLKTVLKPGGTITAIEGDHGSAYFHPDDELARRCIKCLIELQARMGGDSLVGRRLFPLLSESGFNNVKISPRMVYVDGDKPELIEGFTRNTFTAMVEGVRDQVFEEEMMDPMAWDLGIEALYRTAEPDGVFCYTFFKGVGVK